MNSQWIRLRQGNGPHCSDVAREAYFGHAYAIGVDQYLRGECLRMIRHWLDAMFSLRPIRWFAAVGFLCRGVMFLIAGNTYRGIGDFCWIARVSGIYSLERIAGMVIGRAIDTTQRSTHNPLLRSYIANPRLVATASRYTQSGDGTQDLFRDVIVLKGSTSAEKGVLLLKYVRTFEAVAALFDVHRLMDRYVFVLEPCWAGYIDPGILMYLAPGRPVVIQCFTEDDYRFIARVGKPFVPIRLGPADWVDADVFRPPPVQSKQYDLVMVANWGVHKRHRQLFRALRQMKHREFNVLLIGFPWAGRTAEDVRRDAAVLDNSLVRVELIENVPQPSLSEYLSKSKVFVFLSKKEGDNKALVEAMFADVPVIVHEGTIGGAGSRVNAATGVFASDHELAHKIDYMLDHYTEFSPRRWAMAHTGSTIATKLLNETVRRVVIAGGGTYSEDLVEKTNAPNLAYKDPSCRTRFTADYDFIMTCARPSERERRMS